MIMTLWTDTGHTQIIQCEVLSWKVLEQLHSSTTCSSNIKLCQRRPKSKNQVGCLAHRMVLILSSSVVACSCQWVETSLSWAWIAELNVNKTKFSVMKPGTLSLD